MLISKPIPDQGLTSLYGRHINCSFHFRMEIILGTALSFFLFFPAKSDCTRTCEFKRKAINFYSVTIVRRFVEVLVTVCQKFRGNVCDTLLLKYESTFIPRNIVPRIFLWTILVDCRSFFQSICQEKNQKV